MATVAFAVGQGGRGHDDQLAARMCDFHSHWGRTEQLLSIERSEALSQTVRIGI